MCFVYTTATTRVLALAFVAIVTAFIGSTILVQRSARAIDVYALRISRDAAPGIQVVSDLRAPTSAGPTPEHPGSGSGSPP